MCYRKCCCCLSYHSHPQNPYSFYNYQCTEVLVYSFIIIIINSGTTAHFGPRPSSEAFAIRPYFLQHSSNVFPPTSWHHPLGIFYMPQIYDMGPTALLPLRRKACWEFFRPKNPTASTGFEPANLGIKASTLTLDHRSRYWGGILKLNLGSLRKWVASNSYIVKRFSWC